MGLIGALEDQGRRFWTEGSPQLNRWENGCNVLFEFPNSLGARRDLNKQDLATALREFIQEFEHTSERMYQMLYGEGTEPEDEQGLTEIFDWFNLVFRSSIYALVSGWIDDKQDNFLTTTTINLSTGKSTQERTGTKMTIPKKYQRATKSI